MVPALILDTDPGVDDAIAILMALAAPGFRVAGITTVGGNVPLARATRNALALVEQAGRQDVPVARGSARPLHGRFRYAFAFHGRSGLPRRLPQPTTQAVDARAVDFVSHLVQQRPGEVTLVTLGPLTNLARLLQQRPGVLNQCASIVVMGGAVDTPGNVTTQAEFNFYSDPWAASQLLASGVPLTLVDLGACRQVSWCREDVPDCRPRAPLGKLALEIVRNWFRAHPARDRLEFYDPLALAVALDPGIVATRRVALTVETDDKDRRGAVNMAGDYGPVGVVTSVNRSSFFGLFNDLLGLNVP